MLRSVFEKCGPIEEARVIYNKQTKKCKGHGLVQFKDPESMPAAFALHKKQVIFYINFYR